MLHRQLNWRLYARCREVDPEVPFFPEESPEIASFIQNICGTCPVVADCLEFAETVGANYGVFGGTLPAERRKPHYRHDPLIRCGTQQGYRRHRYLKEEPCIYCAIANRIHDQNRAAESSWRRQQLLDNAAA